MSYDEEVCRRMELCDLYTMKFRIMDMLDDIGRLRAMMERWGFDTDLLEGDSFLVPRLVQYEADLRYVAENVGSIIKDKQEASE